MPYFPPDMQQVTELALRPADNAEQGGASGEELSHDSEQDTAAGQEEERRKRQIRIKNRRKFYLDHHPDYFSSSLELADPLLYDRCIGQFQSAAEREADGKRKGYSAILEADLLRSEAKLAALQTSPPTYIPPPLVASTGPARTSSTTSSTDEVHPAAQTRDVASGEINSTYLLPGEEDEDTPGNKQEGAERWRQVMTRRFLQGEDDDFDYRSVDESDAFDDRSLEEREAEERYFAEEEPSWVLGDEDGKKLSDGEGSEGETKEITGQTGIQDF